MAAAASIMKRYMHMLQMSTHCIRETGFGAGEKLGPHEKR